MSTYTRRANLTSCDDCGQVVGSHWSLKVAHSAVHAAHDTTAARAARVQAMSDESCCDTSNDCEDIQ